ncbi:MAG TPA: serine/threonine-protein kinase [Polyangiaceae bacterium]|nr:serine/threonine-protein kinase [Polyangiaceae bacterium]
MISSSLPPLSSLRGRVIESEVQAGVRYFLERHVGEGGMGQAYLARREAPEGAGPVVVKVVRPTVGEGRISAELLAQKEAVALGRLNERVPPCPFVVRFVDTGSARIFSQQPTPWIAIEFVHGGVEGTTLEDRVTYSLHKTHYAFDPVRAAHAIRCLAAGLAAIHGVGVIHRDLTPGNVLCCGFGESEIFKISDFGLARPEGLGRTFAGIGVGTVGYAAPEQSGDAQSTSPQTDVFAFACVIFYLLTGKHYFDGESPLSAYTAMQGKERESLLDAPLLSPELRTRPDACRAIDAALARATDKAPEARPRTADELANAIIPWLGEVPSGPRSSRRLMGTLIGVTQPSDLSGWSWIVRQRPRDDLVIQSAAWDTDGHCFAFTPRGPLFWNGQAWVGATGVLTELPRGMAFARRCEAGGWLVGGSSGMLAVFGTDGVRELAQAPDGRVEFIDGNGQLDDLVVAVGRRAGEGPTLWAMSGGRWLKPMPLANIASIAGLARFDDERWLVSGRTVQGVGFAALYEPLQWALNELEAPGTRAFMGAASSLEREIGLVVGSEGHVLRLDAEGITASRIHGAPDLSAAALDVLDREWVTSLGTLWTRAFSLGESWRPAWSDNSWGAPFVSLMADAGLVVAMTADGGIVEGRSASRSHGTSEAPRP